ncbi:MAG: hypothetical protein J5849_06245 [Clostridia bacterium]|nr:hypothetical protein [Clostridia bacterium]
MPILVRNAQIQKAIEFEIRNRVKTKSVEEGAAVFRNATDEEIGMNMLWGYVSSLAEISEFPELRKPLDLTYETLPHLVDVLCYQYLLGPTAGYSEEQAAEIAEKAAAAYLTLLACNEHGASVSVGRAPVLTPEATSARELWTGFSIEVGNALCRVDFLKTLCGRIVPEKGGLRIRLDDALDAYRLLTGKDLGEYGLGNLAVHFGR